MRKSRFSLIAAASLCAVAISSAEAQTGRLMRSPDAHPEPAKPAKKLSGAAKAAAERKVAKAEAAARPRRSAANTGPLETESAAAARTLAKDEANAAPVVDKDGNTWPSWRYGPDGQSGIFGSAKEVPAGWADHPSAFDAPAEPVLDL